MPTQAQPQGLCAQLPAADIPPRPMFPHPHMPLTPTWKPSSLFLTKPSHLLVQPKEVRAGPLLESSWAGLRGGKRGSKL